MDPTTTPQHQPITSPSSASAPSSQVVTPQVLTHHAGTQSAHTAVSGGAESPAQLDMWDLTLRETGGRSNHPNTPLHLSRNSPHTPGQAVTGGSLQHHVTLGDLNFAGSGRQRRTGSPHSSSRNFIPLNAAMLREKLTAHKLSSSASALGTTTPHHQQAAPSTAGPATSAAARQGIAANVPVTVTTALISRQVQSLMKNASKVKELKQDLAALILKKALEGNSTSPVPNSSASAVSAISDGTLLRTEESVNRILELVGSKLINFQSAPPPSVAPSKLAPKGSTATAGTRGRVPTPTPTPVDPGRQTIESEVMWAVPRSGPTGNVEQYRPGAPVEGQETKPMQRHAQCLSPTTSYPFVSGGTNHCSACGGNLERSASMSGGGLMDSANSLVFKPKPQSHRCKQHRLSVPDASHQTTSQGNSATPLSKAVLVSKYHVMKKSSNTNSVTRSASSAFSDGAGSYCSMTGSSGSQMVGAYQVQHSMASLSRLMGIQEGEHSSSRHVDPAQLAAVPSSENVEGPVPSGMASA